MKTRKFFYLFAAVILVGFIGYATAASNISSPARPFRYGILGKLAELALTEDQKTQIHAILREAQPGFQPLVKQYVRERRALRAAVYATPANEAASRVGQLEADFAVKRAHVGEQIRTGLTPDQITILKELAAEIDSRVDGMIERISNNIAGR
jgi:Spy/CpxP family protein refolding chaperone